MTKLLENIFRSVNIALVNEMAMLCDRMGIDVWEVIDAAATKPFGFMPFWPGPGLGGHCIPIDPFYLTWKAREYEFHTEFIELAGKINSQMPAFCVGKLARALNSRRKPINGSRILVIGVAYKADVNDMRESPALKVIDLLVEEGAQIAYHDPHVPLLAKLGLRSVPLEAALLNDLDAVAVVTAHSGVDGAHRPRGAARRRLSQRRPGHRRKGVAPVTRDAVRLGVVGLNYWGPNLARNFDRLPDSELAWCCDLDEAVLDRHRAAFPGSAFTTEPRRPARRRHARRRGDRHVGPDARRPSPPGRWTPASTSSWRSPWRSPPPTRAPSRTSPRSAASLAMVDHLLVDHPACGK